MEMNELHKMVLASAEVLAWEMNGDVDRVDQGDLDALLAEVTEANWADKAQELAELAYWMN
jgi:hypothetical protein